ncbi:hypothetical protein Unana1_02713 [Umbelopsis nana]
MPSLCCNRREHSSSGSTFASSSALNQYAPHLVIEPIHLDISLRFEDLASKRVHVKVVHTFRYNSGTTIASVRDRSHTVLNGVAFEKLRVEGKGVKHSYDGKEIKLHWDTPFEPQVERTVALEYDVDHPVSGLFFDRKDWMPESDDEWVVTDHETEKARYWLATVDFPIVRTTLTWHITAPQRLTSLANGASVGEEVKDGFKTTHWKLDHRCPSYLACFAVGDFIEVSDGEVDGKAIKYFAAKSRKEDEVRRAFDETPAMIKWLQEKVGTPFPWPKYYQILLPSVGGAMENISLVTWVDTFVLDETNALERKHLTDCVNIHEMAHTYFGDLLVIRHFEHAWLKESWATYIESCWLQDNRSEDIFRNEMFESAYTYFEECDTYMRPIVTRKYDSSWDIFDMHTYPGGAWRIHMLRSLLGDAAFWSGVKSYVANFAQKTVQTSDFQAALEQASGLNLTRFFDEWVYSKGYPKLKADYSYDKQTNLVKISLAQTQVDEKNDIPLFAFPLEIEVVDEQGKTFTTTAEFDRESKITAFIPLPSDSTPHVLRIDPDGKVLFSLELSADDEILENTAKSAKDIANRIHAYYELVKSGSRASLKAVQRLVKGEPFHSVRAHVSDALSKLRTPFALEILAELFVNEKDPLALWIVAENCIIVDKNIRQAALTVLQRDNLPYRAHGSALAVLGAQHNEQDLPYLLDVAKDYKKVGQYGLIRQGALRALAHHRSEEAFKYLLSRADINLEHPRVRPSLMKAIRLSAQWQDERYKKLAIEKLVELLRDDNSLVRRSATTELVALKAKSAYDYIDASRTLLSKDDHPWLDRKLKSLEDSTSSGGEKVSQETVEKLEERIKKLESKLAEMAAKEEAAKAKKQE